MRCGAYARYSSDLQHPASIDDQLLACRRYADHQHWRLLKEHTYTDEALSGMGVQHRPGYRHLLEAVSTSAPLFDILLVDDLSRLSRDTAEILRLVRVLQTQGIRLVSVADGIETGTKVSKLVLSVKAIMNEAYLDDLRDRTLRGLQGRFMRKLHTGGRIFAYRSVPVIDPTGRLDAAGNPLILGAELIIEPQEADVVRQIFTWFAEGLSLRAIANRLNAAKIAFPSQPTQRGLKRKGWACSAVRVILKNEKYIGRWVYGRRVFMKDPVTGRRRARLRPRSEWQLADYPELRIISDEPWQAVQGRFAELGARYLPRDGKGRLAGRKVGIPSSRGSLFSGLLQCGLCGGGITAVSGSQPRGNQRFGCGFHRNKGSQVCPNGLTVKTSVVEARLAEAIQLRILHPGAIAYLVAAVNKRLQVLCSSEDGHCEVLEDELREVEQGLKNIEQAILAGVVGETTAELLKRYEVRKKQLETRLRESQRRDRNETLCIDQAAIEARIKDLQSLLNTDPLRVNAFLRKHLSHIVCTPIKENGQHFYRARGAARGDEILTLLGLESSYDFRSCGGRI
jgi:site-specific DNA recombinase